MHLWLSECARVLKEGAPGAAVHRLAAAAAASDALQIAGVAWRDITV